MERAQKYKTRRKSVQPFKTHLESTHDNFHCLKINLIRALGALVQKKKRLEHDQRATKSTFGSQGLNKAFGKRI